MPRSKIQSLLQQSPAPGPRETLLTDVGSRETEGGRPEIASSRPRASHRADPQRRPRADSGITRRRKRQAVQEEEYTSLEEDGKLNDTDEDPSDLSSSDHGGHDDRQPKRRSSASDFGASVWTTQE
jgi:hypothetical protein